MSTPGGSLGAQPLGSDTPGDAPRTADTPGEAPGELTDAHPATDRTGMQRSSVALVLSGLTTAALGLVFWVLVGRMYPAREVGAASAVITTATMLAAFGNLGLGAYLERFLPLAGTRSLRLPAVSLAAGSICGAVLGCSFLLIGPTDEMFASPLEMALFPVVVVVLSAFSLLDHVTIALGRAQWSAQKNVFHAVAKLVAALLLAVFASRLGLVAAWVLTAAFAGVVVWSAVIRLLRARRTVPPSIPIAFPSWGTQARFVITNYGIYIAGAITPLILPPIVIARVGAESNAYFSIVWSLVSAVLVLMTMLLGPYVSAMSAGSLDPSHDGLALTRKFVAILVGGATVAALCLALLGPLFLRIAGPDYATHGAPLLRLGAIAIPLAAVGLSFVAICRVRCHLLPALGVQVISAIAMLGLTALWIDSKGLIAAGWAMIIAEATAATIVAIPVVQALRGRLQLSPI